MVDVVGVISAICLYIILIFVGIDNFDFTCASAFNFASHVLSLYVVVGFSVDCNLFAPCVCSLLKNSSDTNPIFVWR